MWGDAEGAASLQANDPLATLLFQISSPAHIPWGDQRWQEVLHGYDIWVHMDDSGDTESSKILNKACQSMIKHAKVSSNLAGLSLHVTRMLRDLVRDIRKSNQAKNNQDGNSKTGDFSERISRVGKARATAGSLQLLRLLCHAIVVQTAKDSSSENLLVEAMLYRTRGDLPCDQPAAKPLVYSILDLISITGSDKSDALKTPEVYDAVVLSFELLFVLCGTQLYRPFVSSFQKPGSLSSNSNLHHILEEIFREEKSDDVAIEPRNFRLLYASSRTSISQTSFKDGGTRAFLWTPKSILETSIEWQIQRPPAPPSSIAHYYHSMALAAVSMNGGETVGPDGMYETFKVVQAVAPDLSGGGTQKKDQTGQHDIQPHHTGGRPSMILDATKGVFILGSSIILLPFRLMSLVFGVITASQKGPTNASKATTTRFQTSSASRTRDVLWLSESIVSDLASCLLLLLVNNYRNRTNGFRDQLSGLVDNRWEDEGDETEGLPDLPLTSNGDCDTTPGTDSALPSPSKRIADDLHVAVNFDQLIIAYSKIMHTEIGALLLYTMWQTSPLFAQNLVVRSDVDTLVLPLLRTLYFASNTTTYISNDYNARDKKSLPIEGSFDIRTCPFRSQSQLYVNIILLLLFSQDTSFGRDIFRRITIPKIIWYKERNLRNINLGSAFILTILRALMFNLQRMKDAFLLGNCCAILQNIAPSVVDLHEYAAMRLATVAVSVMKKHAKLKQNEGSKQAEGQKTGSSDYLSTSLDMYEEVCHALIGVIQHCLSSKNIDRNLHLVYALVYHQVDINRLWADKNLYNPKLVGRIQSVIQEASLIVNDEGARTAAKALGILDEEVERLQAIPEKKKGKSAEFTFAYEEEADPEVFFVPYVWETIVSVVTSSTIEWKKDNILVFPLLDPVENIRNDTVASTSQQSGDYAKDVDEVV